MWLTPLAACYDVFLWVGCIADVASRIAPIA